MPYKVDKVAIRDFKPSGDRRRKLDPALHEEIKSRYAAGDSQRLLAKEYGVSRSLIQVIVNPDRAEAIKQAYHARGGWKAHYDKDEHAKAMRDHRQYKHKLYQEIKDE